MNKKELYRFTRDEIKKYHMLDSFLRKNYVLQNWIWALISEYTKGEPLNSRIINDDHLIIWIESRIMQMSISAEISTYIIPCIIHSICPDYNEDCCNCSKLMKNEEMKYWVRLDIVWKSSLLWRRKHAKITENG